MGTYDADGFYDHAETDAAAPGGEFSALLNLPPEGDVIRAYVASQILALSTNPVDATVAAAITSGTLTPPALAARLNIYVTNSAATRNTFWGAVGTGPQRLALHNKGAMTVRTDRSYTEQYFATVADGVPANAAVAVAGWYPLVGRMPICDMSMLAKSIPNNALSILGTTSPDRAYTETYDIDGWHDPVTNPDRITPTQPGDYEIEVRGAWAAGATGRRYIQLFKNGALVATLATNEVPGSNTAFVGYASLFSMNGTTDYITVQAFQNNGGAINLDIRVALRYKGPR